MYRIGLTGGIASGKSTVLDWFKEKKVPYIDADIIARQVVMPGQEGYEAIVNAFGRNILQHDGTLDREALGQIVFHDAQARTILDTILHTPIKNAMWEEEIKWEQKGYPSLIFDIPLLIEKQWHVDMQEVWLVYAPLSTRLQRLQTRNHYDQEHALARIQSQMDLDAKKAYAQVIIPNGGNKEALHVFLQQLWEQKKELFRKDS